MAVFISVFCFVTIISGIIYGSQISNVQTYAIGNRNSSKIYIIAVILGTIIGGPMIFTRSEFAFNGSISLPMICASFGVCLSMLIYGIIAPKFRIRYAGKISAGEVIEEFYGKYGRYLTGLIGVIYSSIFIGAQIKAFTLTLSFMFDINEDYSRLICCLYVLSYGIFMGNRMSSINTLLQFYALIVLIPLIATNAIQKFGGLPYLFYNNSAALLANNFQNFDGISFLKNFLMISFPYFSPPIISIILSTNNQFQAKSSFYISSILSMIILLIIFIIGITAKVINPELDSDLSFLYVIDLVGDIYIPFMFGGIIAIITSSIDIYLNSGSVGFINDCLRMSKKSDSNNSLWGIRLTHIIIILISLIISRSNFDMFDLISISRIFWGIFFTLPIMSLILYKRFYKKGKL